MHQKLDLSIYITTYNHESYIKQALDSILMQKTQYNYEILIGDDVSQDGTREILKKYEQNYPGKFQVYYRDHNMNKEIPNNGDDLRARCKGKYVIALEGDDFWIDEYKIEKQISFLENHPEYLGVAHNCIVVDQFSNMMQESYPECKDPEYSLSHLVSEIMPGQLTTVMYRNYLDIRDMDTSILRYGMSPWDRLLYFVLATYGKIYCMQEKMSAYRHVLSGGSSFSANYKYQFEAVELWQRKLLQYSYKIDHSTAMKCAEILYLSKIWHAIRIKECTTAKGFQYIRENVKHPATAYFLYFRYKLGKDILKRTVYIRID